MRNFKRLLVLVGLVLLGLAAFLGASPVLAAGPTDYLADMPTVKQVTAAFVGTDAFDTAARQYVAFERLDMMMGKLIGVSLVALTQMGIWAAAFLAFSFWAAGDASITLPHVPPAHLPSGSSRSPE